MIKVCGTTIEMTRGDTLLLRVIPTRAGEPYIPLPGDTMRFALKRDRMNMRGTWMVDPQPLIRKDIPIDTMLLRLEPEDTSSLDFGNYMYDCELTMADGFVSTFIADAKFKIEREAD